MSEDSAAGKDFVVSFPEAFRLVANAPVGTEETALVVPELPLEELHYHRALVDGGTLVEHAVISLSAPDPSAFEQIRKLCQVALNSRKPTEVSFLEPDAKQLVADAGRSFEAAALAAVIILGFEDGAADLSTGQERLQVDCAKQGRIFSCRVANAQSDE